MKRNGNRGKCGFILSQSHARACPSLPSFQIGATASLAVADVVGDLPFVIPRVPLRGRVNYALSFRFKNFKPQGDKGSVTVRTRVIIGGPRFLPFFGLFSLLPLLIPEGKISFFLLPKCLIQRKIEDSSMYGRCKWLSIDYVISTFDMCSQLKRKKNVLNII